MKKLTALFLSLAMIFATISLTAVPVSAASSNGNWNEIFSYYELGENQQDILRSIKIYQKDKATLLSCKSALKIVTTEQKNGRTITKTYETPMYTPWYYFTDTPLTAREIFEKDANLKDSGLFETFEKLDAYVQAMEYSSTSFILFAQEYSKEFKEGAVSLLGGNQDVKSIVFSSCKDLLGIETPLQDLLGEAIEVYEYSNTIGNKLLKWIRGTSAYMMYQLNPEKVENLTQNYANTFFKEFYKFAN